MTLTDQIKTIQRAVGATPDGTFGPETARLTLANLARTDQVDADTVPTVDAELDERTMSNIDTLDAKARDRFIRFAKLAKATAATYGCDYVLISGNRTYAEQNALYAQSRTKPGAKVTNAKGGYSNHNFGIAGDFGVFCGKAYLDNTAPATAAKIHKACSMHAAECGLEWGGSWTSMVDQPHYEVSTGLTTTQKRTLFEKKGSVLP